MVLFVIIRLEGSAILGCEVLLRRVAHIFVFRTRGDVAVHQVQGRTIDQVSRENNNSIVVNNFVISVDVV